MMSLLGAGHLAKRVPCAAIRCYDWIRRCLSGEENRKTGKNVSALKRAAENTDERQLQAIATVVVMTRGQPFVETFYSKHVDLRTTVRTLLGKVFSI
ncbi:hypothetical protein [Paraburkholderia acidicola]|uniref:Uncharacterized protein n=1 Tax=Paraburkholderia acidicola TaxID=1912599 RepID=A0ABV1LJ36_9BURK|nr:hypothetical protein [Paraburkholderia acidicola]